MARDAGIIHLSTEDDQLGGRTVRIEDQDLINFSSCSYLGLELDPRVKQGAIEAVMRYGTQFSSSRAYLSLGLYDALEDAMERIFQAPVLVSATTTLGHLSYLPVLAGEGDLVILDHQVHASVQMAAQVLKAKGARIEMVRHNRVDMLEHSIRKHRDQYQRIWYLADGVYSMYGDFAPAAELMQLLNTYEQLHLYVDDAHGASWTGQHGCGFARTAFGRHERLYMAVSLNKSFAGGGGLLIFPDAETKRLVRNCGGTLIFSGPMQPALLGAVMASASVHLSPEIGTLQQKILDRIRIFNETAHALALPQPVVAETPIGFIKIGDPGQTFALIRRLMERGYYVNAAAFPSVPYKASGVRVTLHNHLEPEDITGLLETIAHELPRIHQMESYPDEAHLLAALA